MNSVTKVTLTALVCLFCLNLRAQEDPQPLYNTVGSSKIGLSISPTFNANAFRNAGFRFEHFMLDKFSVALQTDFSWGTARHAFGTGLFGRYYLSSRSISPFLEAGLAYQLTLNTDENSTDPTVLIGRQLQYGGGVAFNQLFKSKNLGLEFLFGLRSFPSFPNRLRNSDPYLGIRFTYKIK